MRSLLLVSDLVDDVRRNEGRKRFFRLTRMARLGRDNSTTNGAMHTSRIRAGIDSSPAMSSRRE